MRELFNRVFKKEEGFSLIELIIVIAILAIIAAIAVPTLLGNIQRANEGTDISNAKLIGDAIATVIAQDPTLEGTVIDDELFSAAGVTALGAATDEGIVLANALAIFANGEPELKFSEHNTIGDNFRVSLSAVGVINVFANDDATTPEQLYPQP